MSKKLKNYIYSHIKNLGIKKNDKVLVYSDLSRFGVSEKNLPKIIVSSIKNIIGKKGTIVMPFYILGNTKNYIFNKKKFIFTNRIGSLTKVFCKEKKLVRSKSLIHNHIGLGPDAKILNFSDEKISIGKNSDFEHMKNLNFKLLLLACDPIQGATYLHHLEAIYGVPYRKWIIVKKKVYKKKIIKIVEVKYYAKKNNEYVSNFNSVFKKIKKFNLNISEQKVKYGMSFCLNIKNLDKIGLILLKKNAYAFVKKNK